VWPDTSFIQKINLSYNLLDTVSFRSDFVNLRSVDLSHNELKKVEVNFSASKELGLFNLSYNRMKFEELIPLLYHLPKKLGKLEAGDQKVNYRLIYDKGMNSVYFSDVLDKTDEVRWYVGNKILPVTGPFLELKKGMYYRDVRAFVQNPFFPGAVFKAGWR
jgi:hypothetical protein